MNFTFDFNGQSYLILIFSLISAPLFSQVGNDRSSIKFTTPQNLRTNSGYFKLEWEYVPENQEVEGMSFVVEQADNKDFEESKLRYQGSDLATYVSGMPNGEYFYRVKVAGPEDGESDWSEPVKIIVEHHSLQLAFILFILGTIVFIMTVGVVYRGVKNTATD